MKPSVRMPERILEVVGTPVQNERRDCGRCKDEGQQYSTDLNFVHLHIETKERFVYYVASSTKVSARERAEGVRERAAV